MSSNRRGLQGTSTSGSAASPANIESSPVTFTTVPNSADRSIRLVALNSKLPGLSPAELKLLRQKQKRLATNAYSTLNALPKPKYRNALESTLIFAQYEAGTAVCVDSAGWILTCAHCFGDTEQEYEESNKKKWLLLYTGLAVHVECRIWDGTRDLALLKVIAIESSQGQEAKWPHFAFVPICTSSLTNNMPIRCIGQPGRDDLESTPDRHTKYNLVEISQGTFRGNGT